MYDPRCDGCRYYRSDGPGTGEGVCERLNEPSYKMDDWWCCEWEKACQMCSNPAGCDGSTPTACSAEVGCGRVVYLETIGTKWYIVTCDDCDGFRSEPVHECPWCGRGLGKKGGGE